MKSQQITNSSIRIVKPGSEIGLAEIEKEILESLSASEILLDLSDMDYINSAFIGLLLRIKNERPTAYRKIKLVNPNEIVGEILSMTQVDRIFEIQKIYPTAW